MNKRCPFNIPLVHYGMVTSTVAILKEMTPERVKDSLSYGKNVQGVGFDVKHDGCEFSVGSGSCKQTFYFKNWSAE